MQDIIKPIDRALLKAELTEDKKLRRTNKSNNEIYIVTAHDSPNVMQEIGRLREIAFRYYGGGTGFPVDIDEYDTMDNAYRQLIVWSPEDEQILGGYRFLCGSDVKFDEAGKPVLATSHLFDFSEKFNKEYLPYTVELGRSFVTLEYQSTRSGNAKGLFVLDNLWDGLGALSVVDPSLQYYFGKVTMYNTYNSEARNMILYFLNMHFPDPENSRYFPGEEFIASTAHVVIYPYPVPYRCLYSRNVDNLFMAGRNISVTHVALGTVRVMRTTGMMGEVVGMAAALCRLHGATPRDIYHSHLPELKELMKEGVARGPMPYSQKYNEGTHL